MKAPRCTKHQTLNPKPQTPNPKPQTHRGERVGLARAAGGGQGPLDRTGDRGAHLLGFLKGLGFRV